MIFYPDAIIPDSGLTGPNNIYIYKTAQGIQRMILFVLEISPTSNGSVFYVKPSSGRLNMWWCIFWSLFKLFFYLKIFFNF